MPDPERQRLERVHLLREIERQKNTLLRLLPILHYWLAERSLP